MTVCFDTAWNIKSNTWHGLKVQYFSWVQRHMLIILAFGKLMREDWMLENRLSDIASSNLAGIWAKLIDWILIKNAKEKERQNCLMQSLHVYLGPWSHEMIARWLQTEGDICPKGTIVINLCFSDTGPFISEDSAKASMLSSQSCLGLSLGAVTHSLWASRKPTNSLAQTGSLLPFTAWQCAWALCISCPAW